MTLALEEAKRITEGAMAKARDLDIGINVAVCDAGGRLIAFQHMDDGYWASGFGSQGKAMASAAFAKPSGSLIKLADHPTFRGIRQAEGDHMIFGQGAVPIFHNGKLIGACGVGGGTGEQDEQCAQMGAETLRVQQIEQGIEPVGATARS